MDIAAWLRGLGLEAYEAALRDNDIDAEVLPELTEAHLAALGLPLGPRLKLLKAIAALPEGALPSRAPERAEAPAAVPQAERRQLTVMFCDLVGSTALSARLDPEDLREVIGAYHSCVAEAVRRFDGFVAK
jgi:class 3 adenylate cyclase